jgi:alpha-amylase/alpha-mannosidase (GH57 family)
MKFLNKKTNTIKMEMTSISKINLYCQKLKLTPPYFKTLKKCGEDHHPTFQVSCAFEKCVEIGEGSTLKIAKKNAASKIVEILNLDQALQNLNYGIKYTIESYGVPLKNIYEESENEYILTIKKKVGDSSKIKKFKVCIIQEIE